MLPPRSSAELVRLAQRTERVAHLRPPRARAIDDRRRDRGRRRRPRRWSRPSEPITIQSSRSVSPAGVVSWTFRLASEKSSSSMSNNAWTTVLDERVDRACRDRGCAGQTLALEEADADRHAREARGHRQVQVGGRELLHVDRPEGSRAAIEPRVEAACVSRGS